ncbi:MAG: hydrogenase iron-sulfur subunit [Candidatus Krumholzibacteria bacterium]|nr:hydrogenase iron-sulfur subunit [Candidatus Krumholzibacteria bacterium]
MPEFSPKILVFSTDNVSDPGIDLAGRNKMHYPSTVYVISVPCSSAIKPSWIVHAIESGFDGVFIAADGSDCSYVSDCTARTAKTASAAQGILREKSLEPGRVRMAALCSVCAESFQKHMKSFGEALRKMGPAKKVE